MIPQMLWPLTDAERREAERRELQLVRKMLRCVHNTHGTISYDDPGYAHLNRCAAGIDHRTVTLHNPDGWTPGPVQQLFGLTTPCTESKPCSELLNPGGATCPKRRLLFREEALAELAREAQEAEDRRP